jgi:hypothetical protein
MSYLPFNKTNVMRLNIDVDWLIDWLFTVLRPAQEFFTYMETSISIAGEGLQNLGLWAGRDLYRAIPAMTQDLGFSGTSHPKDRPI